MISEQKIIRLSSLDHLNLKLFKISDASLCYGIFNVLHPGHFRYFDQARKYAEKLYVPSSSSSFFLIKYQYVLFFLIKYQYIRFFLIKYN